MDFQVVYELWHDSQPEDNSLSKSDVIVAVTHLFLLGRNFKCVDSDGMVNRFVCVSLKKSFASSHNDYIVNE